MHIFDNVPHYAFWIAFVLFGGFVLYKVGKGILNPDTKIEITPRKETTGNPVIPVRPPVVKPPVDTKPPRELL